MSGAGDVAGRVREFVLTTFPVPGAGAIADDDSLLDSGIVDSMGILTLVEFVEEAFGIQVDDDDLVPENFASVAAITAYVSRRSGASA